jgi:hypothetical protein
VVATSMSANVVLLLLMAFVTFVVAPIALVWSFVDGMRTKASDRPGGGGGLSNAIGAAMLEADRLLSRPSIEYQIETEHPVLEREDDKSGD